MAWKFITLLGNDTKSVSFPANHMHRMYFPLLLNHGISVDNSVDDK